MATIKSYTTIEQSRKLAEILPLESADMFWQSNLNSSDRQYLLDTGKEEHFNIEMNFEHYEIGDYDIPAWSLAALLNALPNDCGVNKEEDKFVASYLILDECGDYTSDNPIDACYEMILYLHELNL